MYNLIPTGSPAGAVLLPYFYLIGGIVISIYFLSQVKKEAGNMGSSGWRAIAAATGKVIVENNMFFALFLSLVTVTLFSYSYTVEAARKTTVYFAVWLVSFIVWLNIIHISNYFKNKKKDV